jgi:hypothetical protein
MPEPRPSSRLEQAFRILASLQEGAPISEHYDYDAARQAGVTGPDDTGHWPSEFKRDTHPRVRVGGFDTRTGARAPGTPQAGRRVLEREGWAADDAARMGEGGVDPLASHGRREAGNVDLYAQPSVQNPDGGMSTVHTTGIEEDGLEINIPRVTPDGRYLEEDEARDEYHRTGRHLGKYEDRATAARDAGQLHEDYADGRYAVRPMPSHGRHQAPEPVRMPRQPGEARFQSQDAAMAADLERYLPALGLMIPTPPMSAIARSFGLGERAATLAPWELRTQQALEGAGRSTAEYERALAELGRTARRGQLDLFPRR